MEEINEDRADHGKKPFDGTKATEEKAINESTTDPESGVFHKGEHKKCFAYTAQTGCDKNGYVMDVTVNSGNVHDSVAFDGLYERLIEKNPEIEAVVMDAGYKTPWISKRVLDDKRIPVLPYKRPMGKQDFFKPYEYVYDKYYDCVICPRKPCAELCYNKQRRIPRIQEQNIYMRKLPVKIQVHRKQQV